MAPAPGLLPLMLLTWASRRLPSIHPALPDELPGVRAIERAWAEYQAGQRHHSGVMVHVVVPEVDAGPVVAAATVPITAANGAAVRFLEAGMFGCLKRVEIEGTNAKLYIDSSKGPP